MYVAWIRRDWQKWFEPLNPFTKRRLSGMYPAIVKAKVDAWRLATGFNNRDGELLILPDGEKPWLPMQSG